MKLELLIRYWTRAAAISLLATSAVAQKVGYRDFNGTFHIIDESKIAPKIQAAPQPATIHAGNITFVVTYDDVVNNTKIGFDNPTTGATARATYQAVLMYIGSVIANSGTCEIEWQNSLNDGASSGGSTLASAGPFYSEKNGFYNGFGADHIITGVDPSTQSPDIQGQVDFGFNWNLGMGNPGASQTDFYSVLLHETTHGLGLVSLAQSNGKSEFDSDGFHTFTTWDDLLYTGNGLHLWSGSGTFNGTSAMLKGSDGGVFYRGAHATALLGTYPRIYAPSTYSEGSSISHWNDATFPTKVPVMTHAITDGTTKRAYQPFEVGALQDIGYTIVQATRNSVRDWQQWK